MSEHSTRNRCNALAGSAGFTIVEMITAIALFVVMGLVAMPSFSRILQAYELRGATRQMFGELQRARASAVMSNTRHRVVVDGAGEVTVERFDSAENEWTSVATLDEWAGKRTSLEVSLTNDVIFAPNGTAPGGATITLLDPNGLETRIVVTPAGSIRVV